MKKPYLSLRKFFPFFLAYLMDPSLMPVALAAFLMELNLAGFMSSQEIINDLLSYKGLKPNIAFKSFDLELLIALNPLPFINSLN